MSSKAIEDNERKGNGEECLKREVSVRASVKAESVGKRKWRGGKKGKNEGKERRKTRGKRRDESYLFLADLNGRPDVKRSESEAREPSSNCSQEQFPALSRAKQSFNYASASLSCLSLVRLSSPRRVFTAAPSGTETSPLGPLFFHPPCPLPFSSSGRSVAGPLARWQCQNGAGNDAARGETRRKKPPGERRQEEIRDDKDGRRANAESNVFQAAYRGNARSRGPTRTSASIISAE